MNQVTDWQQVSTIPIVHPRSQVWHQHLTLSLSQVHQRWKQHHVHVKSVHHLAQVHLKLFFVSYILIVLMLHLDSLYYQSHMLYVQCAEYVQYKVMWILISDYFNINWFSLLI